MRCVPALESVGCSARSSLCGEAVVLNGKTALTVRVPGRYHLCSDAGSAALLNVLPLPRPAFDCNATFGPLCPVAGIGALSAADVGLATDARLRVFLYDLPREYHAGMYSDALPKKIRLGRWCDFARTPCVPPMEGLHKWTRFALSKKLGGGFQSKQTFNAYGAWYHKMQNAADVPLLAKLLALAMVPGVRTRDPREAHLFVVPFLGGFRAKNTPWDTGKLDRHAMELKRRGEAQGQAGPPLMTALVGELAHFRQPEMQRRHLFLLTLECTHCLRRPCRTCHTWHKVNGTSRLAPQLQATLGPGRDTYGRARGAEEVLNIVVPANVMDLPLHPQWYTPLCGPQRHRGRRRLPLWATARRPAWARPGGNASGTEGDWAYRAPARDGSCRSSVASERPLLLFYQGAHADNSFRGRVLRELRRVVYGADRRNESRRASRGESGGAASPSALATPASDRPAAPPCKCADRCNCAARPRCCVNEGAGLAFFHVGSHWAPQPPLDWSQTVAWMQRARFCLCPGGDTPYTKRFFLALLAGCVPVVFAFPSYPKARQRFNWWQPGGPANDDMYPFANRINYSELVLELPPAHLDGFVERLRAVPDNVVEWKQRRIEEVRHSLIYDTSGAQAADAFTMVLRELIEKLV